ncbi:MAG: hypothetical protein JSW46_06170 [Gemmatimonadota bacterium]|nr:MAG: hypothetical protein JSW46_06170 [Gemmatimonadota bacterium]
MSASRIAFLFGVLLPTAPINLLAQQEPFIEPGDTVKVAVDGVAHEGIVLALKPDTLLLDVRDATAPLALLLASVTSLKVKRGQESRALIGGLKGLLLGAGGGAFLGYLSCACEPKESDCVDTNVTKGVLIGGVFLGGIGFAIGSGIKVDRWETVPLDKLRVGLVPQRTGRLGLAVCASIRF